MRSAHAIAGFPPGERGARRPPGWPDRIAARVRGPWLDAELARGTAPWQSPAHAARAIQLTGNRSRRMLAQALERLIDHTERPSSRAMVSAVIAPCREQVRAALPTILAVSSRLRSSAPVEPRGVARLRALLCDGAGPCYVLRKDRNALAIELQEVSRWLEVND